ncbi:MAG: c-type cytochrome, partial [Porticoccaceae bacterium]|nr:c-type cytochrome [Porticoccaceae bacterium]
MHRYMVSKWLLAAVILTGVNGLCWASVAAVIAKPESSSDEGEKLYQQRCAACHDGPVARAPHKIMFPMQGPEYILSALNDGIMQAQASGLSEQQKIALAEHLGGRTLAVKDA